MLRSFLAFTALAAVAAAGKTKVPNPVWCAQWNGCMPGTTLKPNAWKIACTPGKPITGVKPYYPWCSPDVCCDMVVPPPAPTTCYDWFEAENMCPPPTVMPPEPQFIKCSMNPKGRNPCSATVCCSAPPPDSHCNAHTCADPNQWPGSGRVCSTFPSKVQCSDSFCKCGTNPWS